MSSRTAALHLVSNDEPETACGLDERDEAALVKAARGGDREAWGVLYRDHFDEVYRYALYLAGDVASSDDIAQEAFMRAWTGLRGFRGRGTFKAWLRQITLNVVRRHWRRTHCRDRAIDRMRRERPPPAERTPEDDHVDARRIRALYAVLDVLDPKLREAFVLRDMLGLPSAEAASTLGIRPGNLAVRAHRARTRVRELLAEAGWMHGPGGEGT